MFFKLTTHTQYVTEHASEKPILDLGKIMFRFGLCTVY